MTLDQPLADAAGKPFDYSNVPDRPVSTFVRLASLVLPGVRSVQGEVRPYAREWERANQAALLGTGPLWVALGDSMTQAIGASAWDRGWVHQALAQLDTPYRVVNLAASGARVQDVLDRQLPALEALGVRPDLVTVLIGSNDLGRQRDALPERFSRLLARLPAGSVVANMPNPSRAARAVNAEIADQARAGRIVQADMTHNRATSWRGRLAADHFHPNEFGYEMLAGVFATAIRDAQPSVAPEG